MSPAPGHTFVGSARAYVKRGSDLTIGSVLLVLSMPVILIGIVAVRLESPGPPIFRQVRIGRGRRPFTLFKLRTMRCGAELGSDITQKDDPRVTQVGRFLRRTRIDELPQLWNVVRGDMSLVGPRPEQPRIVAGYPTTWNALLDVRPGLTDEATLAFRDEAILLDDASDRLYEELILPAKVRIALAGVHKQSLSSDLSILLLTAGVLTGVHRPPEHPEVTRIRTHLNTRTTQIAG